VNVLSGCDIVDQPNVSRSTMVIMRKITAASAKTNTAPKARFVTAEKLLARDIRNDATRPNSIAKRTARMMSTWALGCLLGANVCRP